MRAIVKLGVELGPYSIRSCEVDAETSGPGWEQEHEDVGPFLEVCHHVSAFMDLGAAV